MEELDEELMLPPEGDRDWLMAQVEGLVRNRSFSPLVNAPLLTPDPQFFPDPWKGGQASARRLARRLLRYAGLEDTDVDVEIDEEAQVQKGRVVGGVNPGAGVELLQAAGSVYRFSVLPSAMKDPGSFVPAMARAVAEAWLRSHNLTVQNEVMRQRMIDVTAVYLGFGILTTNAAQRTSAISDGSLRSRKTTTRLGLLSPRALAYLLAIQALARGLDRADRTDLGKMLAANERRFFKAACEALLDDDESVPARIGLPPEDQWPPPPDMRYLTAPFEDEPEAPEEEEDVDRGVVGMNDGKPVFRVERDMSRRLGGTFFIATFMLGGVAGRMNVGGGGGGMSLTGIAALVLGIVGFLIGKALNESRCSEPECGATIPEGEDQCPRCLGTVSGIIHHPKERLAAEEELRERELDQAELDQAELDAG